MTAFSLGNRLLLVSSAAVAAMLAASRAEAAAFYLQDQSVKGLGRAYSGEVSDVGAASLWWNPAAIAGTPNEIYVGAQGLLVTSKVKDAGSTITRPVPPAGLTTPVGGSPVAYDPVNNGLIPNFAAAYRFSDRFAVGISAAAPFDFISSYPSSSFARYDGLRSRLTTEDFQLTGAARALSWLDLGLAFNAQYTSANLAQSYPNLSPLLPDGASDLKGDGFNYGYTVGARAHGERWAIGASYRSAMDHNVDGRVVVSGLTAPLAAANISTSGRAEFRTPWIATLGANYQLTDALTLNAQVERFGWSEFSGIYVTSAAGPQTIPTNYRDTTSGAVGVDYRLSPMWTFRAGVGYDQTPIPNTNRSSLVPDSDRELYTVGVSMQATPKLTVDAGFGYIAFNGAKVNNARVFYQETPAATLVTERGAVTADAELLSVGLRYRY